MRTRLQIRTKDLLGKIYTIPRRVLPVQTTRPTIIWQPTAVRPGWPDAVTATLLVNPRSACVAAWPSFFATFQRFRYGATVHHESARNLYRDEGSECLGPIQPRRQSLTKKQHCADANYGVTLGAVQSCLTGNCERERVLCV